MTILLYDIYAILSEIYVLTCVCWLLIYGVLLSTSSKIGYPLLSSNVGWLSLQISLFSLFIVAVSPCHTFSCWNRLLINDFFVHGAKLILIVIFLSWFFLSLSYTLSQKVNSFEYWVLALLGLVGTLFIVQVSDLLSMYLAIEFQSLVFYVLASFKRTSEFSTESGLKYFILGAFSSALLLFGSSVLYSLTGLTNFGDFSLFFAGSLNTTYTSDFGLVIGLVFISVSLLFKLSAAPFHMWSPDVYEGAPLPITALFSILPKLAILTLLLRFCLFSFYDFLPIWQKVFTFCSYLSILLGTLSAFSQKKWKRFIAYSSINHVGFFLVGLSTGELEGTFGVLFYLSIYIAGTFGFFFFLSAFKYYQYPVYTQVRYLKSLKSLSYFNPVLAGTLTVFLFSMAGIPPLAGFFAKFFILFSALQNNTYGLVIFSVLMSSIACFYYIRLVKTMYFDNTRLWMVTCPVDKTTSIFLGLFMFVTIFIFLDLELFSLFLTRMLLPFLG